MFGVDVSSSAINLQKGAARNLSGQNGHVNIPGSHVPVTLSMFDTRDGGNSVWTAATTMVCSARGPTA